MDERSQKILDGILAKDPSALTEEDKQILRARWHYVGRNSRAKFAEVLAQTPQEPAKNPEATQQNEKKSNDPSVHPADQDDDGEDEEDPTNGDSSTQDEE